MRTYNLIISDVHKNYIELIKQAGGKVIVDENKRTATTRYTHIDIPIDIFNQLEFIGIVTYKRTFGKLIELWVLNKNVYRKYFK